MSIYDSTLKQLFNIYCYLFSDGLELSGHLPLPAGAKIIAANHTNASDPLHFPFLVDEKIHFLIMKSTFDIPILGQLLKKTGQISVNRQNGRPAFAQAYDLLQAGKTIAPFFPEGKLCLRNKRVKERNGAVRMALKTGVPIIPLGFFVHPNNSIALSLPGKNQRPNGYWQFRGKCYARVGEPYYPNPANPISHETNELMQRIYALVDQRTCEEAVCASPITLNQIRQW
jgi:1-acyl-sn-glycerol-3-phosphate acyltransferase